MDWVNSIKKGKKRRGIGVLGILAASLLCLFGCVEKQVGNTESGTASGNTEAIGLHTNVFCPWDGMSALMADGAYYWNDTALNYTDIKTGETYLMCYDPTCDHKWRKEGQGWDYQWKTGCTALLHGNNVQGSRMVGDTFYSIRSKSGDFEKMEIMCSKLDQTDETLFATLDMQDSVRANCWYKDEQLYLAYWNLNTSESDEDGLLETESCVVGIYQISLKDGKVNKLVERSLEQQESIIQNMFCNEQYLWYSYEFGREDGTHITQIWRVELSSGKETMIREFAGELLQMNAERLLFVTCDYGENQERSNIRLFLSAWEGETELIHEMAQWYEGLLLEDKVLFTENLGTSTSVFSYEFATNTTTLCYENVNMQLRLEVAFPDIVYFSGQGAEVDYGMFYIPMQELLVGNFDAMKKLYNYNVDHGMYYER